MNNEWEQEPYVDPNIEKIRQKNQEFAVQWEAARKREIVLVTGIVVTFIARFLKLYWNADILFMYIKFMLNVVGLVLYMTDLDEVMKMADTAQKIFLVLIWLFLRPFYFIIRAGVLNDEPAMERGIVYGIAYFFAWVAYFWAYLDYLDSLIWGMFGF